MKYLKLYENYEKNLFNSIDNLSKYKGDIQLYKKIIELIKRVCNDNDLEFVNEDIGNKFYKEYRFLFKGENLLKVHFIVRTNRIYITVKTFLKGEKIIKINKISEYIKSVKNNEIIKEGYEKNLFDKVKLKVEKVEPYLIFKIIETHLKNNNIKDYDISTTKDEHQYEKRYVIGEYNSNAQKVSEYDISILYSENGYTEQVIIDSMMGYHICLTIDALIEFLETFVHHSVYTDILGRDINTILDRIDYFFKNHIEKEYSKEEIKGEKVCRIKIEYKGFIIKIVYDKNSKEILSFIQSFKGNSSNTTSINDSLLYTFNNIIKYQSNALNEGYEKNLFDKTMDKPFSMEHEKLVSLIEKINKLTNKTSIEVDYYENPFVSEGGENIEMDIKLNKNDKMLIIYTNNDGEKARAIKYGQASFYGMIELSLKSLISFIEKGIDVKTISINSSNFEYFVKDIVAYINNNMIGADLTVTDLEKDSYEFRCVINNKVSIEYLNQTLLIDNKKVDYLDEIYDYLNKYFFNI